MVKKIALIATLFLLLVGGQAYAQSYVSNPPLKTGFQKIDQASVTTTTAKQPKATTAPSIYAYILPGVVAVILIIGLSGYWLIFRKRQL